MGNAHLFHVIQQGFSTGKQPALAACRLPQTTPSTPTNSSHRPQSQLTPRPTILNGTTMKTPIANKQGLLLANPSMKMTDGTLRLRAWAADNRCQPPPHRLRQSPAPSHDQQKAAPFARPARHRHGRYIKPKHTRHEPTARSAGSRSHCSQAPNRHGSGPPTLRKLKAVKAVCGW